MKAKAAKRKVEIRRAAASDAAWISSVLRRSFAEFESSYTPRAYAATTPSSGEVENRLNEGPAWVAIRDDRVIGAVSVVDRGDDLYLRGMAVLPDARGQGVGEMLLRAVEGFARELGRRRLILCTTPFLTGAIRLYENSGFQRTVEGPGDLFGTPLFTMAKSLDTSDSKEGEDG
jgi:ribosomal protein S18 acetylase RimI-like enzyme